LRNNKLSNIPKKVFDKIILSEDENGVLISSNSNLSVIGDLNNSKGFDTVNNILISFNNNSNNNFNNNPDNSSNNKLNEIKESYISHYFQTNECFVENSSNISIINFINSSLEKINIFNELELIINKKYNSNSKNNNNYNFKDAKLDLGQIIIVNSELNYKELLMLYKIAIKYKERYFVDKHFPCKIQEFLNKNEFLAIVSINSLNNINKDDFLDVDCKTSSNKDFIYIKKEFIKSINKSFLLFFKKLNLDFGILDYIYDLGFNLDDLVNAGMELLVGVDDTQEIRDKLKSQLLLSITDINVIALIVSAIRCEEDFMAGKIREVDVSDDPAYLYTDEVLGLAIANQIAGTKATFNFKRYDENKPGILSKLDPMSDDIFAGLIAGAMSKIFEEH
jgi:alpha-ribazole phosphatase CobZ